MLIKCPECQRDISDAATSCPGCGHPMPKGSVVTEEMKQARSKVVAWLFVAVFVGLPALVGLMTGTQMIIYHEADPRVAWCMSDPDINRSVVGEGAASGLSARDLCKIAVEDAR